MEAWTPVAISRAINSPSIEVDIFPLRQVPIAAGVHDHICVPVRNKLGFYLLFISLGSINCKYIQVPGPIALPAADFPATSRDRSARKSKIVRPTINTRME